MMKPSGKWLRALDSFEPIYLDIYSEMHEILADKMGNKTLADTRAIERRVDVFPETLSRMGTTDLGGLLFGL